MQTHLKAHVTTRDEILFATERLLQQSRLHDITVADIIWEADVSRATFYSYFTSKHEVVANLLGNVMSEMYTVLNYSVLSSNSLRSRDSIRQLLTASIKLWSNHRAVLHATHENWRIVPELEEMWLQVVAKFTAALAEEVDRERAAAVLWSTSHLLYIAGTSASKDLTSETSIIDTLVDLWLGVLHPD